MHSPLDRTQELEPFFELRDIPVFCNVLHDDGDAARATARGDLTLGVCPSTGFVFNQSFDPALVAYTPAYENSLHFSPRFSAWAREIAGELTRDLPGDTVVEIGCGQGDFLRELASQARCHAIGFDTSLAVSTSIELDNGATLELRSEHLDFDDAACTPDLVLNRHVLEHVQDPIALLREFRKLLSRKDRARLYVEVPNALWTLEELGVWDLIYEHCGYFAPCALRAALEAAGFAVDDIRPEFGEQFLAAFARPTAVETRLHTHRSDEVDHVLKLARSFRARFADLAKVANTRLERALRDSARVVIWGAGSKGVMLLNLLDRGRDVIAAVDKNPRKKGKHLAGTGHVVVEPRELQSIDPDVVLVANPIYATEIAQECKDLGLGARIDTI